eukprot:CAMPEP_0202898576 /NCGR_PEP_ID=MMETSP1392-20130828/7065_1 /ASSEMBLY_ACC=CAM_ASM_000868 /TAXON_ID=225041 /ORGANISM="Chlamydomonas chlamydogama, Strain SAG 11-48b" /LENGTH=399 /DNA_ID=CAMNT_0049584547 /DNA_START=583 /DNA_END=1782 /DNA_ORIENTATION=-
MEGDMQLGDFGLAAHKQHDKLVERVGTLDYMAPEVLAMPTPDDAQLGKGKSLNPYTEKVDVWAVGVLSYELLVGRPPFEVEDPKETAHLIMHSPVGNFPPGLSNDCKDFIQLALSKKAGHRPSADELLLHTWVQQHLHGRTLPPPCSSSTAVLLKQMISSAWTMRMSSSLTDVLVSRSGTDSSFDSDPIVSTTSSSRRALSAGDEPATISEQQRTSDSCKGPSERMETAKLPASAAVGKPMSVPAATSGQVVALSAFKVSPGQLKANTERHSTPAVPEVMEFRNQSSGSQQQSIPWRAPEVRQQHSVDGTWAQGCSGALHTAPTGPHEGVGFWTTHQPHAHGVASQSTTTLDVLGTPQDAAGALTVETSASSISSDPGSSHAWQAALQKKVVGKSRFAK